MLYNYDWENNYEQLITYYPRYYRDVWEMVAILKAHGAMEDELQANVEQVLNNAFIDTADEETIAKLEKILGIPQSNITGRTLDERRGMVKAYFIGNGHLSASMLKEMIAAYTDAEIEIELTDYDASQSGAGNLLDGSMLLNGAAHLNGYSNITAGQDQALYITIVREGTQHINVADIVSLLQRVIPAHLAYYVSDNLNTIVDNSTLENVSLIAFQMSLALPYWELAPYAALPGLQYNEGMAQTEESFVFVSAVGGVSMEVLTEEQFVTYALDILQAVEVLNNEVGLEMRLAVGSLAAPEESITGYLEKSVNLWRLDGSLLLDGSTLLNSTYEREDL